MVYRSKKFGLRLAVGALALLSNAACAAPVASTPLPSQIAPLPWVSVEDQMLALHNRERALVGVPPLAWDPVLAANAAAYAPILAASSVLEHSPAEMRRGQGENLWTGTRGAFSTESMFSDWASEKRWFRPGIFPHVVTQGDWSIVGHYTQIVWRGTTHVGCVIHRAPRWDYLICRYAPQGNIIGDPVP